MVNEFRLDAWLKDPVSAPFKGQRLIGLDPIGKALFLSQLRKSTNNAFFYVLPDRASARNTFDNLLFFLGENAREKIHYLPSLEFDFYRGVLPNPDTIADRNKALYALTHSPREHIFITTIGALLQKTYNKEAFQKYTFTLTPNQEIEREAFIEKLECLGYQRQPVAYDPGVFAIRGSVIDIFCPLYPKPIRLEFYGDYIDEMRFFDAKTQLSEEKVESADVIPVSLVLIPHSEEMEARSLELKEYLDHVDIPKAKREELVSDLRERKVLGEHAFLFPILSRGASSIFQYVPEGTEFFWDGFENIHKTASETEIPRLIKNHALFQENGTPIAAPEALFLTESEVLKALKETHSIYFENFASKDDPLAMTLFSESISLKRERDEATHSHGHALLEGFITKFRSWMDQGYTVNIVTHTNIHAERLQMLLTPYSIPVTLHKENENFSDAIAHEAFQSMHIWQGYITESRLFPSLKTLLLSEDEIFGTKKRTSKASKSGTSSNDPAKLLASFRNLKEGDYVVHKDFGIGRYLGLKSMQFQEVPGDYVLLEYLDGDKLYIPVYRLNILQKYVGGEAAQVKLDKLGGEAWAKVKTKAQKAIAELAAEFLDIQAKRKLIPAHRFQQDSSEYRQFEMEFPFDETVDQQKAIDDVSRDLARDYPMDRLVCGDVGYGKTEVAMRAACHAVLEGKQVAVLVPTTVLAFQHFENFKSRFKNFGINIEMVSRLKTSAEIKKSLLGLKEGAIDIIIGTHRLLSPDVHFKSLELLIIDEEHRFGVLHKERLKKLSESIHVLSMTATPIPRTLNMAMAGLKEISIITTPPPDRLSVRTFVCRDSDEVIVEAITNELARDGQVFFVHNRIETIFKVAAHLKKLLPKADFEVAHGQMDPDELEEKILGFFNGKFHVLLTTAIIESGLDVPRANTIIIDRADRFGLAQLYQLRGRVGRSEKRAYCYLVVPPEAQMTPDAKERLQIMQRYSELGSGFSVASHDLELRGAGDLLGKSQHGHLNAIGVDMYFELLEESIAALRGKKLNNQIEPEITIKIAAYFPNDYLADVSEKVLLYRRLSAVDSDEKIAEIEKEIHDRFGPLPPEVINLLGLMSIKIYLKKLHVLRMSSGPKRTSLQFADSTPASPEKLVRLIQSNPKLYALTPDQKFVFTVEDPHWRSQLREVQKICDLLA